MIDSPLFRRIARPGRIPSGPLTALIAGGTAALVLALTLPALMPGIETLWRRLSRLLSVLLSYVTVGLPVVLAGLAAWWVSIFRQGESFETLRVTPVSAVEVAQGVIWGVAYRLRVFLAVGAGLTVVQFVAVLLSVRRYTPDLPTIMPPLWLVMGLVGLQAVAVVVTHVGWMLVGVVLGAVFGLEFKRGALVAAPTLMAALAMGSVYATQLTINALVGGPSVRAASPNLFVETLVPVAVSLLPLLALMGLWRIGVRALRKL